MRKLLFIIFILAFILPLNQAFAATPVKGGELVVCQPAEPPGLDPTANTAAAIDRVVFSNIYEGLVKVNRNGTFVPGLATAWTVSPGVERRQLGPCLDRCHRHQATLVQVEGDGTTPSGRGQRGPREVPVTNSLA